MIRKTAALPHFLRGRNINQTALARRRAQLPNRRKMTRVLANQRRTRTKELFALQLLMNLNPALQTKLFVVHWNFLDSTFSNRALSSPTKFVSYNSCTCFFGALLSNHASLTNAVSAVMSA